MNITIKLDSATTALLNRFVVAAEAFVKNTGPSPYAVSYVIALAIKGEDMQKGKLVALSVIRGKKLIGLSSVTPISDSLPQPVAIFGMDAEGNYGASLAPGASIALSVGVGGNGGTPVSFAQDAAPGSFNFTDPTGKVWTNIPSIGSGVFTPTPAPGSDPNDPFTFSYLITGGTGDSGSAQFQTAVGVEVSEVIGLPTAVPASGTK